LTRQLKIYVVDAFAHRAVSGYGMVARFIVAGLVGRGHDVRLMPGAQEWAALLPDEIAQLEALADGTFVRRADVVLHIGLPLMRRHYAQPSVLYTMNALGDIKPEWVDALSVWDALVVPSEFDRAVFARRFERVFVAPLGSNRSTFKPVTRWRPEGWNRFTFLFVGSYSFRKGVDLLLEAFLCEFSGDEPVEPLIQAPGAGQREEFDHCLELIRAHNPLGRVRLRGGTLSPAWMNRIYNRCDCVITLSRGEGWCMPLSEALLCGVPVIAPNSTAMAEYLDDSVAELLPVREIPATEAPGPFGSGMKAGYGFPGVTYYEPDGRAARKAMRLVYEEYPRALEKARAGRHRMLTTYTPGNTAQCIEAACTDLLQAGRESPEDRRD
jgi:glycosyltransferase involved in cell wall biosynthesis